MGDDSSKDNTSSDSDSDIEEGEEHHDYAPQKLSDEMEVEYASFAELDEELMRYCASTFQTYVKKRSDKLERSNRMPAVLQYRKIVYACVHDDKCKSKGPYEAAAVADPW